MTARGRHRPEFRAGEMTERSMNDLLRSLFLRVEALERVQYVDWVFTTDGAGNYADGFVFAPPSWAVRSITPASVREAISGYYAAGPSLVWKYASRGIEVDFYQALSPSTSYTLTLEVRG